MISSCDLRLDWSGHGQSGCGHSGTPSLGEEGRGCTDAPSHSGCTSHLNDCNGPLGGILRGAVLKWGGGRRAELKWYSIEGEY